MKERYYVSGMTCSACSSHVEKTVNKLEGMHKASVNLLTETMEVEYDEQKLKPAQITDAVKKAGYGAALLTENREMGKNASIQGKTGDRGDLKKQAMEENRAMKWRLGISIGFLIPLMYVAMCHMYHQWFGLPIPEIVRETLLGNENAANFALTQFLLLIPILYMNRKFFVVGFRTLRNLSPNMDSLIALGASAAIGYGIFAMYRIGYGIGHGDMVLVEKYSHDLYFESAGMILTLITVGKYLESRSKGKTGEAITKLMDLSPKMALLLTPDGREQEIPTESLQTGDIFLVEPGAAVPADGIVLEGSSGIDEAAITGESVPVEKREGDKVIAATINKAGFLKCRADHVGADTTLAQIIRLVEEAGASKAPIAKLADKVAGVFVPIVIGISLVTLLVWLLVGAGAEFAISSAIAVLVISCPCALGLATPVAIMVGTGVGASHGILIKSGEALQQAKEVDTVVLDKTGTITSGNLRVMGVWVNRQDMSHEELVQIAASLEKKSEHPLAEAVLEHASVMGISTSEAKEFKAVFGRGVEAVLDGVKYFVGNQAYLTEKHIDPGEAGRQHIADMSDQGMTMLLVADEKQYLGAIGVADAIRVTSAQAITQWKKMGVRVIMLTGDNKRTAEAVQRMIHVDEVVAEVLPADKEQKIRELKSGGHRVAMIGDGINDAPALAAADVGMAIGAGTDVAMESADIVLMKSDLRDAVTAMKLSRSVIRNIKQNLFWAFFYNSIGIPLAAGVWYPMFGLRLNPMFGAAAMSLSSIFVVGNALRLRGFKSGFEGKEKSEKLTEVQESCIDRKETERSQSMTKVMTIEGMMCSHCTGRVQKALESIEGVSQVTMKLEEKTATVVLGGEVSEETLITAVTDAGYEVKAVVSDTSVFH